MHGINRRFLGPFGFLLFDTGRFADFLAEIVETAARNDAAFTDDDALDARTLKQKRLFDAHAVRDAAHRDGFAGAAALADDHHAFEHLRALFAALEHFGVHLDGVPGTKLGEPVLEPFAINYIYNVHRVLVILSEGA